MKKIKELEKRIKMIECALGRGHSYHEGHFEGYKRCVAIIKLKCLHCDFVLARSVDELKEKERAAAVELGLLPE